MRKNIKYIGFTFLLLFIKINYIFAEENMKCEDLISDEIQDIINTCMMWVRILVPIALIVFGVLDFGKAVLASKEDDMKKAQATFTKRLIIGVIIFFIPTVVNIVIYLANEYLGGGMFCNADWCIK